MPVRKLDLQTANKIAAGEVVENPSSVVKELVENSIDAGARRIKIQLKKGGLEEITVIDDGLGIAPGELRLALQRHATSKIFCLEDLQSISSLGFRGEALPSIASVSRLSITTRQPEVEGATFIYLEGGREKAFTEKGAPLGTRVTVKDLFYNTPARLKFLKSITAETSKVSRIIQGLALSRPEISFTLEREGKTFLQSPGDGHFIHAILSIYGIDLGRQLNPLEKEEGVYSLSGYLSGANYSRNTRNYQLLFVNQRMVRARVFREALDRAFARRVTSRRYPLAFFHFSLPAAGVDVNVHPSKTEVRFCEEEKVRAFLENSFNEAYDSKSRRASPGITDEQRYQYNLRQWSSGEEQISKVYEMLHSKSGESVVYFPGKMEREGVGLAREERNGKWREGKAEKEGVEKKVEEIELEEKKEEKQNLSNGDLLFFGQVIGQLFATYILIQQDDILLFIDQHAAHERVLWEKLQKEKNNQGVFQQEVIPFFLELPVSLAESITEKTDLLWEIGLKMERFGNNTFIVRSIPFLLKNNFTSELLLDILEDDHVLNLSGEPFQKEVLLQLACKGSVKANQALTREEIYSLLEQLKQCHEPYFCPHGRPVFFPINKKMLEKHFNRG